MIKTYAHCAALFTSTALAAALATPALAQTKHFAIPAQSAGSAIGMLGRQGDVQIVAARTMTQTKRTNAVYGDLTVSAALARLLRNTGLTAKEMRPSTYAIVTAAYIPATAQGAPGQASDA